MPFSVFSHRAACDKTPERLQIRSFTPDVYNAIKRREDWRSEQRRENHRIGQTKSTNCQEANVTSGDSVSVIQFKAPVSASLSLDSALTLPAFGTDQALESREQRPVLKGFMTCAELERSLTCENEMTHLDDGSLASLSNTVMFAEPELWPTLECEAEMPYFVGCANLHAGRRMLATAESTTSLSDCTSSTAADTEARTKIWTDICSQSPNPADPSVQSRSGFATAVDAFSSTQAQERWTGQQDELLLHLRDVAQLSWPTITADYFSFSTVAAIKRHYRSLQAQLGNSKVTQSRWSYVDPKLRAPSHNTVVRATSPQANGFGRVSLHSHTFPENMGQRTRSGRVIKEPFRYWAGERYVWKSASIDGVRLASGTI